MSDASEPRDPASGMYESARTAVTLSGGAWIFLSHSHPDIDKMRQIRNALESKGHYPVI
jgi:hypothetical protein